MLLDEFEKAHGDVHKKFLTAWNDGYVTEASDGRQVSTSRAIFVLTSNAATTTVAALGGRRPNGQLAIAAMLAQIAGGRVTAMIMLFGAGLASDAETGFPSVPGCQETRNIYNRVFVDRNGGEQACWSVDVIAVPWADPRDLVRASAAAELRQRGATLPEVTVRTRFPRANRSHLLRYDLYQAIDVAADGPGGWDWSHIMATPERLARMTRQRDWAASWWLLIERGFTNQLGLAEVTPPLARLPS